MISNIEKDIEALINEEDMKKNRLEFLGQVPCPIKPAFKEEYDILAREYFEETGKQFFSYVPTSCGDGTDRQKGLSNILMANTIDEIPDIGVSFTMGDYCNSKIIKDYVSKGYFESAIDVDQCEMLKGVNLKDPYNAFSTLAIFASVIMVDKRKIKDLPIPKKWNDLLDPVYKDSIAIPGGHGDISVLYPMYVYKEHGEEGLEKLEHNVCNVLHGSKVAKIAGTNNSEGAPIYVVSWFFAKACANTDYIEIIWPEEGAYIEPEIMIVKKDLPEDLNKIVDFMKSEKVSKIFADNYFISTYKGIDNKLPEDAKFKWIGWDYIFENPVEKFKDKVQNKFCKYVK